jgi:hypothetical protein
MLSSECEARQATNLFSSQVAPCSLRAGTIPEVLTDGSVWLRRTALIRR